MSNSKRLQDYHVATALGWKLIFNCTYHELNQRLIKTFPEYAKNPVSDDALQIRVKRLSDKVDLNEFKKAIPIPEEWDDKSLLNYFRTLMVSRVFLSDKSGNDNELRKNIQAARGILSDLNALGEGTNEESAMDKLLKRLDDKKRSSKVN